VDELAGEPVEQLGMCRRLAHPAGKQNVEPSNVAVVGLRSVDEIERLNVRGTGVNAFTMRDIDERGMTTVMQQAIHAASSGTACPAGNLTMSG